MLLFSQGCLDLDVNITTIKDKLKQYFPVENIATDKQVYLTVWPSASHKGSFYVVRKSYNYCCHLNTVPRILSENCYVYSPTKIKHHLTCFNNIFSNNELISNRIAVFVT